MSRSVGRPLGLTLVVALIALQGLIAIAIGLNLTRVLELTALPARGSTGATGAAMLIVGVAGVLVAAGLFTMRFWAYVIVVAVLFLTIFAGIFALIQHGLNVEAAPSLIPALVSAVVLGYLLSDRVRPLFDG